jgi:hypothetical protein
MPRFVPNLIRHALVLGATRVMSSWRSPFVRRKGNGALLSRERREERRQYGGCACNGASAPSSGSGSHPL